MKNILFLFFQLLSVVCIAHQKRALVIGIDTYEIPQGEVNENGGSRKIFPNLKGCKNDALSIQSVIISRFGFDSNNIQQLFDRDAIRQNILAGIDELLKTCKKDDIAFLYYAGHGSQVNNSLSKEADKKDETIVPSDTWRKGISDITDKELAKRFNQFIDKGIKLTVIFDCCHSGSLARGIVMEQPVCRFMEASDYDTKDASNPMAPELREGDRFLILSAAQSNELAQEQFDANRMPHGAFTIALLNALNQQAPNAPASRIFSSLRSILKSNGKRQEPVIGGSIERQNETLLAIGKDKVNANEMLQVNSVRGNRVEFDGGFAQQILKDNELLYTSKNNETGAIDSVLVKIDTVLGISKSAGYIVNGNAALIQPGVSFSIVNWVAPKTPLLKVYIPGSTFSYADVMRLANLDLALKKSGKIKWMNDLDKTEPAVTLFFRGKDMYVNAEGKSIKVVTDVSLASISKLAANKTCFFNLPPDIALAKQLKDKIGVYKNIALVDDASEANYILYGTINENNQPAYGFARAEIALRDSLDALPLITDHIALGGDAAINYNEVNETLFEYAMRIAKVRGWLNLSGPKSADDFPYALSLEDNNSGEVYDTVAARLNSVVTLFLVADNTAGARSVSSRYVYVFVIDKDGRMQLLFPQVAEGNAENRFPHYEDNMIKKKEALLSFEIGLPVGTDSYYLIASADPINNLYLFNQDGVRASGARGNPANENPLAALLEMGNMPGAGTRGITILSADWTLKKMQVKTMH